MGHEKDGRTRDDTYAWKYGGDAVFTTSRQAHHIYMDCGFQPSTSTPTLIPALRD